VISVVKSNNRERYFRTSSSTGVSARVEAWEGKDLGGVRVLLANPRWERRLVKFLELSGVGRVMADGTDEDGAYAARMDEWVVWESVEGAAPRGEG
jgi:hypothetical protein